MNCMIKTWQFSLLKVIFRKHHCFTVYRMASGLADGDDVIFTILIFTQTEGMGTSASCLPVVDLVFPKDFLVAMPVWSIPSGPILWDMGDTPYFSLLLFIYFIGLIVLNIISSLTGLVLKIYSTSTSIVTSYPYEVDCFVDVNVGHSLH